jgi:hypothetical protein
VQINVSTDFLPIWCSSQNFVSNRGYCGVYVTAVVCPTHSKFGQSNSRKGKRLRIKNIFYQIRNLRIKISHALSVSPCPNYPNNSHRNKNIKNEQFQSSVHWKFSSLFRFGTFYNFDHSNIGDTKFHATCLSLHTASWCLQPQVLQLDPFLYVTRL